MENIKPGSYTSFRAFDAEEKGLFDQVMKGFISARHIPLAVASKVEQGTKYAFFCDSKGVYPGAVNYNAFVIIYKPLTHVEEAPILLEIKEVEII